MKTRIVTVMLLCATSVIVAGCATRHNVQPTVDRCDVVYVDIVQDSTDSLRQIATNNEMIESQ